MKKYTRYYPEYAQALEAARKMSLEQLLKNIDALYGRDNLKYGASVEDVREELFRQLEKDFRVRD